MSKATLENALGAVFTLLSAVASFAIAFAYGVWEISIFAVLMLVIAWEYYVDDDSGVESVRQYIHRKRGK